MISEQTVFILGAGASRPYGYPTAFELRGAIISNAIELLKKITEGKTTDFDNHPFVIKIKEIIEVFRKSSTSSIDLFLSRNKEYYEIGKQILAMMLANFEMVSKFREDVSDPKEDWYSYFYEELTREIISIEDLSKVNENKISIITFNYDRSLEYFLSESLLNSFRGMKEEVHKIMNDLNIIHVYGKLAPLNWELINGRFDYKAESLTSDFRELSYNIKIIYEERQKATQDIIETISNAKKIFFLGFGYADENLEAIGLHRPILKQNQELYGTAFGFTDQEITRTIVKVKQFNPQISYERIKLINCDSKMLLRNYL